MLAYNTRNKGVIEYDLFDNFVFTWRTISEAGEHYGIDRHRISKAMDKSIVVNDSFWKSIPDPDLDGEVWKDISNKAKVSNKGRFHSKLGRKHFGTKKSNYMSVFSDKKHHFVHRLVAKYFLSTPTEFQTQVDHVDGDPTNNDVSNLEWVTPSENLIRANKNKER
jgi:hypothetical protein